MITRNVWVVPPVEGAAKDLDPERKRLAAAIADRERWYRWGPYLSERQWGTVREDYSANGDAWHYFPHDHARSRAYRWGEDGLLGICDERTTLCFALALWNGQDPIIKERFFGLSNPEGNHGEDVKEYYCFLDNTPTHSYMKALYKYPQRAFPYRELVEVNGSRSRSEPEYELLDTGIFEENRYFDVVVEYAKASPEDILVRISVTNRGPDPAALHLLPTLWYRNAWSWGREDQMDRLSPQRPELRAMAGAPGDMQVVYAVQADLGERWFSCEGSPTLLFTENESNAERLWDVPNRTPYVKDGINNAVVHGDLGAVNPANVGTKVAAQYILTMAPGETQAVYLRLSDATPTTQTSSPTEVFTTRQTEADLFFEPLGALCHSDDARLVLRQSLAGLLWSKQYYDYDVAQWLEGDPAEPPPPPMRQWGRNHEWQHLDNDNVISMPDTWEYPWYAAWDTAFHCVSLALADAKFAKRQLILLCREWYMRPNGQLPAYEWDFGDVNPPVHAWAALRVYRIERQLTGIEDRAFLERVFLKLLLNFTWWVNRQDREGRNIFQGGFLGLDNIGVFDRSTQLPTGGYLEQSDGTAWMGMYCLNMLDIALELAREEPSYEDIATKFFEHFMYIAGALNNIGGEGVSLWDEEDEFFYDVLRLPDGHVEPLKVRSLVGLIPLLAVQTMDPKLFNLLPHFKRRMDWFLSDRPDLASLVSRWYESGHETRLLALVRGHRMKRLLARMLDPNEFLSDHGVRSLSKFHLTQPYVMQVDGSSYTVQYEPAESSSGLFGGNSNWRGPVWLPLNYLFIEAIRRFHEYYGDDFLVECPTGSGSLLTLHQIADELAGRLTTMYLRDADGRRAAMGDNGLMQRDPNWSDHLLFYEYFHGDTAAGLGASHQTGWTALIANLLIEPSM
jgi:hypothetical protein